MACQGCNDNTNPSFFSFPLGQTNPCAECGSPVDSLCVIYTGPDLQCFTAGTNLALQDIIVALDAYICNITVGAGYDPAWNTDCLLSLSSTPITTMQEFVESISSFVCTTQSSFEDFLANDYASDISGLQSALIDIQNPNVTPCPAFGITELDSIEVAVSKLSEAVCSLAGDLSLSGVNWGQCFTVVPAPINLTEGFDAVIDMICQVQASIPVQVLLPTFDNTGSCLPAPTTTDSLVLTINNIRDLLCTKPDFSPGSITTTCMGLDPTDLNTVIQSIVDQVELASESFLTADPLFFGEAFINPLNPCEGKHLTFTGSLVSEDRSVALDAGDLTPGNLVQKIVDGDNIGLDFGITNPGQLTITSTDEFIRVTPADPSPGHLLDKLDVLNDSTGSISFSEIFNAGTGKMEITPTFNFSALASQVMNSIVADPTIRAVLCAAVCDQCLPCTTPPPALPFVSVEVFNDDLDGTQTVVTLGLRQNAPAVIFLSETLLTIPNGSTFTTGGYFITGPGSTMNLTLNNENAGTTMDYSISVEDENGAPSAGATNIPNTNLPVPPGGDFNDPAFNLGTSLTGNYVIKIRVNKTP